MTEGRAFTEKEASVENYGAAAPGVSAIGRMSACRGKFEPPACGFDGRAVAVQVAPPSEVKSKRPVESIQPRFASTKLNCEAVAHRAPLRLAYCVTSLFVRPFGPIAEKISR